MWSAEGVNGESVLRRRQRISSGAARSDCAARTNEPASLCHFRPSAQLTSCRCVLPLNIVSNCDKTAPAGAEDARRAPSESRRIMLGTLLAQNAVANG